MSRQENRLQNAYSFWHSSRASGKPATAQPYDQQLQQITSFDTVEGFWKAYSHMSKHLIPRILHNLLTCLFSHYN